MSNKEVQAIKKEAVLGKEFTVYGDALEPLFLAKDVADMLDIKNHRDLLTRVDDDEKVVGSTDTLGGVQETWFLTEDGLYEVLMQSRKPIAKAFKKKVKEVLKDLRIKGFHIGPNAKDEALDFDRVFGKYRLRKTIRESNNRRQLLEQFIQLSAIERTAGRMSNKDRINSLDTFADEIESIVANEAINMRGSELLALQELLTDISKEKNRLSNKMRGGVISNKTRKIRQLEEELAMTQDDNEDDNWFLIPKHPMSNNYLHDYLPGGGRKNSSVYRAWISNLHLDKYLPDELPDVDITKPMEIHLLYGHMPKFDTLNFEKAIADQISKYYGFDDKLFKRSTQELHSYVSTYNDGYFYVRIVNIDDPDQD